jgi:uncharacterized membrane protein YbhN (UPF0104 family)
MSDRERRLDSRQPPGSEGDSPPEGAALDEPRDDQETVAGAESSHAGAEQADEEREERQIRIGHVALGVVGALIVGVLLIVGIGHAVGFTQIQGTLDQASFGWLAVCVFGQITVFGGYTGAMRQAIASEGGPTIPLSTTLRLVFASFAATQLLAFGGVGGLVIVYWGLRRVGMERESAATRLIGLSTAVYLVFGVIGWCAATTCFLLSRAPLGMTVPWMVGIPLVVLLASWFTEPVRVDRWTAHRGGWLREGIGVGVGAAAWVRRALGSDVDRPMFGWAACYWLGDVLSLWGALHAFGISLDVPNLVLAYATGYIAASLPIPLIATGGVDAATTFLLHSAGVPLDTALLAVVTHRIFAFWLPVIPGVYCAFRLSRTGRLLHDASEATAEPGTNRGPLTQPEAGG